MRQRFLKLAAVFAFAAVAYVDGAFALDAYTPPSLVNYCVGPTENPDGTIEFKPGFIDLGQFPSSETDVTWISRRYRDYENRRNPGARRGTSGFHEPEYRAALVELGYAGTKVETRDAYCSKDEGLLSGAVAVRISGNESTPFEPGIWYFGRRGWDTDQWRTSVTHSIPRRAIYSNMGKAAAEQYIGVVRYQVELAELACKTGSGPAADPAAGAWELNKAGKCRAGAWTRPGALSPAWARPVTILGPAVEGDISEFNPGRLSTGFLSTDMTRR